MVKICPDCNTNQIDEKYARCLPCNNKAKTAQKEEALIDVLRDLRKEMQLINNNLAYVRAAVCKDKKLEKALQDAKKSAGRTSEGVNNVE